MNIRDNIEIRKNLTLLSLNYYIQKLSFDGYKWLDEWTCRKIQYYLTFEDSFLWFEDILKNHPNIKSFKYGNVFVERIDLNDDVLLI